MSLAAFAAMGAAALPFIEALLKAAPELVADVKGLIDAIEGKKPAAATDGPLAPQVIADTQPLVDKLQGK